MHLNLRSISGFIFDFLIPDSCSVCGRSLVFERHPDFPDVPLCRDCVDQTSESVLNKRYPNLRKCSRCGYPLISENLLCGRCREKDWSFTSAESLFFYSDTAREIISAYKFDNRKAISYLLAKLLHDQIREYYADMVIVPVPFRPSSKRKRGWDQVRIIAENLNQIYGLTVLDCLKRSDGPPQKSMDYHRRLSNLEGKIQLRPSFAAPENVLLLDDVFTTGATMDCCASVLISAGTAEVRCLAIALDL